MSGKMAKRKAPRTHDYIDILDKLDGSIGAVIKRLQALQKEYPDATIDVGTRMEYGETYAKAELCFERDKTPLEIELAEWQRKAERLRDLQADAQSFYKHKIDYPQEAEIATLRKELGFFAMAPMRGSLHIFDGEILVSDMMRGSRRRDGTFVLRMLGYGDSEEMKKHYAAIDAEYAV